MPCMGLLGPAENMVSESDCSYDLGRIEFLYVEGLRMWKDAVGCVVTLG